MLERTHPGAPASTAVTRYIGFLDSCDQGRGWGIEGAALRFSALSLVDVDVPEGRVELERMARELRRRAGWCSPLKSTARYTVAALMIRSGIPVDGFHERVRQLRRRFRDSKLPRAGLAETLAAVLLVCREEFCREEADGDVSDRVFDRLKVLLDLWRRNHPLISGTADYPMAAFHACSDEEVTDLGRRIENIYKELNKAGFGRGRHLQMASHVLAAVPWWSGQAAGRFRAVAWAFDGLGVRVRRGDYEATALLALSPAAPDTVARVVDDIRRQLREGNALPFGRSPLIISAGLALARDGELLADNVCPGASENTIRAAQDSVLATLLAKAAQT